MIFWWGIRHFAITKKKLQATCSGELFGKLPEK
jgi:hypothetical protein